MPTLSGLPDWRDWAAYRPLLGVERSGFAWEWLRRQPGYRTAAFKTMGSARQPPLEIRAEEQAASSWGLHCFEDPELIAPSARPIWRSDRQAFVLRARSEPCSADGDALILDNFLAIATIAVGRHSEHLLLSDGLRSIRLDVSGTSLRGGPARLAYELEGFASVEAPLLVLRRLRALVMTGRFSRSLHRPERRARRLVLLLRTHDALAAGASQREIAAELLGLAAQERWRVHASSIRSQGQRLVQGARKMAAGGFWALLR